MKNFIKLFTLLLLFASCQKDPKFNGGDYDMKGGAFILNEGNYMAGNGSLSFWSYDSLKIYNDMFQSVNGRPLGDVPYSMMIKDEKAYIVVNNSGKIEVINNITMKSVTTIHGLISPRIMAVVNSTKAYVSSLYSDSVTIVDIFSNSITGYINLRRTSEAIAVAGNFAYISNWAGGHEVMVVNTLNNQVIDSIDVGIEPESMVLDGDRNLWVLCTGGWSESDLGKLVQIDINSNNVIKQFPFNNPSSYPTSLIIDSYGQNLFYLDGGVRKMGIADTKLPASSMVPQPVGSAFYKLAINPANGDLFISDALDYSHQGYLWIYTNGGDLSRKETVGIIPGTVCFKLRY
jgi:DNA-binding beta-propeller fold protein YncE